MEDALSPELRNLPKLDLSKEAVESLRLDWNAAPQPIKVALENDDVSSLRSFLRSEDLHAQWYAAHALGRVTEEHLQAKGALREFISSHAQTPTDGNPVRAGVMQRFMEDAAASEASRSLDRLPDYTFHWWALIFVGVIVVIGLARRVCHRRMA